MKLLIVESPGKVKKIQGFLGNDWKVAASVGHVRDLPTKDIGVYPPDFKPQYIQTDRGKKVIAALKQLVAKAQAVCLATDPDREGEAIAWHLQEALSLTNPDRVTYAEITEKAVNQALTSPRKINLSLVRAQEGRRVLDRLVGYKVSPVLGSVAGKIVSAGRVQTPTVRLVVEREAAIKNFKSTTHFGVELLFNSDQAGQPGWKAVWNLKNWLPEGEEYFLDQKTAQRISELKALTVASYAEGEAKQSPPAPFTTSTLQQAASNALKVDPKETMELAQKLYEAGHITYMRTDSPNLSEEAIADIRVLAAKNEWPLPAKPRAWKSKEGAQEAHEAIRPTHFEAENAGDSEKEAALYKLIRVRALASQLEDAVFSTIKAALKSELDGKEALFDASGRKLKSPGWKVVLDDDQAAADEPNERDQEELNNPIPPLQEGSQVNPASGQVKTKKTKPPARFTQASLIRELEKRGIGRPSTYAAIMDNIVNRGYITPNAKRQLEASELGMELIGLLKDNFGFIEYEYTKNLEDKLDEIAEGKADYLSLVKATNEGLNKELSAFSIRHGHGCPDCGQPLRHLVKTGQGGYNFWACSDRENCGAKFQDDHGKPGEKQKSLELSEHKCSTCGKPLKHILKEGEGGYNFWACSDRNCGQTYPDVNGQPGEKTARKPKEEPSEFRCQACKSPLYHRRGHSQKTDKDYDFFACSNKKCGKTYNTKDDKPEFK
jgi:DNA topoisomerase-1